MAKKKVTKKSNRVIHKITKGKTAKSVSRYFKEFERDFKALEVESDEISVTSCGSQKRGLFLVGVKGPHIALDQIADALLFLANELKNQHFLHHSQLGQSDVATN